jgi:ribosomal protein L30E
MRGGSRNAIAKNKTPIARAKIKMYATLSIPNIPAYRASNYILPVRQKRFNSSQLNINGELLTNRYEILDSFFTAG